MKTIRLLPIEIRREITAVLLNHQSSTLSVYAEADKIRRRWLSRNIALEDIVGVFVEDSGSHGVAIAFEPGEARAALIGSEAPYEEDAELYQPPAHNGQQMRGQDGA